MKKSKKKITLIVCLALCTCILVGLIGLKVKLSSDPRLISVEATQVKYYIEDYEIPTEQTYNISIKMFSMRNRKYLVGIGSVVKTVELKRGINTIILTLDKYAIKDCDKRLIDISLDNTMYTYISTLRISDFDEKLPAGGAEFQILEEHRRKDYSLFVKPVIYLYPEEETEANVDLYFHDDLYWTSYYGGWNVIASPDGILTNLSDGRNYDYLFWEGNAAVDYQMDNAVCVKGENTCEFLEEYLAAAGLNDSERDDFIDYWLPKMQDNPYNLIAFQGELYEQVAELHVTPEPDSVLRIFMTFEVLDEPVECGEFSMPEPFERNGFTVVECCGTVLSK